MLPSFSESNFMSIPLVYSAQFGINFPSPLQPRLGGMPLSQIQLLMLNAQVQEFIRNATEQKAEEESSSESVTPYTLDELDTSDGRAKTAGSRNRCVCDECGKTYATSSNLSRHKQTHRPLDSPHAKQCPHCERVYVSMPALSMHILTHKANHECPTCGKMFSRLWLLQGHMRSHTGQRPFGCAHCGKSFADRSNLRAHILTHTGEKRFNCSRCGRKFALRSYLNRHQESSCKSDPEED